MLKIWNFPMKQTKNPNTHFCIIHKSPEKSKLGSFQSIIIKLKGKQNRNVRLNQDPFVNKDPITFYPKLSRETYRKLDQKKKKRKKKKIQDLPSLKELAALSKRSAASSYLEPNNPQPLSFFSAFFSNSSALAIWSPILIFLSYYYYFFSSSEFIIIEW